MKYVEVERCRILAREKRDDSAKLSFGMELIKVLDVGIHLRTSFFTLSTLESFLKPLDLEEKVFVSEF